MTYQRFALVLLLAGLGGCADPRATMTPSERAQYNRCDYDARRATAGISEGFQRGYETASLRRQCLDLNQ